MNILSNYIKRFFVTSSIKQKLMLIIMAVSLIGLATVSSGILINESINMNKIQKIDMDIMADLVADASSGFLVFNDKAGASVSLSVLSAKKQITRAFIYNKNKELFVIYKRDKGGKGGKDINYDDVINIVTNNTELFYAWKKIIVDGEVFGYLYLESDDSLINEFVFRSVVVFFMVLSIAVLIAYMLASRLQRVISEPIEHLTETALKITSQQNYSLRAEKESEDEIGVLTDGFNKMLTQLQIRNHELIESENKFREVVEQSVDALFIEDEEGCFIDVNYAAYKTLGYGRYELMQLGMNDIDVNFCDDVKLKALMQRLEKEKHITVDSEFIKKNGEIFPVEVSLGYVNIEGKNLILVSARDITERKQTQEKLEQANDMLEAKVNERTTELKRTNIELSVAKEKAESANYAKSLFLANMSHEIRTPMNAVIGFTDVLASSGLNEQQKGYIKSIQSGSRNLLSLINDILDLSKIEAGKMKIESDVVYIKQLLEDIKQVFSISAKEKGLVLDLVINDSMPSAIMSDELRLRQILFNLISNAIKFTSKGSVKITAEYKHVLSGDIFSSLIIKIEDTGIGIAEGDRENIFNIFEQQDNQNTREFGGAGLGLAISTRLAEKLNAEILLESEPGKGSCFKLIIRSPEIIDKNIEKDKRDISSDLKFKSATILIVDDLDMNRELIREYLADQEIEIIEASDGLQAIDIINSEHPDLVLMDIRMPKMNGIDATQHIREDPLISDTPVVAITASVVEDKRADKKRSLFDSVLYKPVNKKTLLIEMSKILDVEISGESDSQDRSKEQDAQDLFEIELKNSSSRFVEEILGYQKAIDRAKNRGSFGELHDLVGELCELAAECNMQEFKKMMKRLDLANQQFDIEETIKLLSRISSAIDFLQERHHD